VGDVESGAGERWQYAAKSMVLRVEPVCWRSRRIAYYGKLAMTRVWGIHLAGPRVGCCGGSPSCWHALSTVRRRVPGFATLVGASVEIFQIAAGTYRFTSGTVNGAWPPPGLLAKWAQFATTFRFSLRSVIAQPLPAALFGAAGGPIAFIAGQRLGAVTLLPPQTHGLLRLSITWAIALVAFSVVVRRVTADGQWPRYRTSR
jgi:hypothetical protein